MEDSAAMAKINHRVRMLEGSNAVLMRIAVSALANALGDTTECRQCLARIEDGLLKQETIKTLSGKQLPQESQDAIRRGIVESLEMIRRSNITIRLT